MENPPSQNNRIIWPVVTRGIFHQQFNGVTLPDGSRGMLPDRYDDLVQNAVLDLQEGLGEQDQSRIASFAQDVHAAACETFSSHCKEVVDDAELFQLVREAVQSAAARYVVQAA